MRIERRKEFQRNQRLESLLQEINGLLGPVEDRILQHHRMPKYPVVLIVGCPRSGSTLIMQWLASTGKFAYPTNLLSRFSGAPYIGALIQQLLTAPEFSFRDEFFDLGSDISFSSSLGKTRGALAPNEFWYFWRRFFPQEGFEYLDKESLQDLNTAKFTAELAALEAVFGKPFAMKGLIINSNIPYISSVLDKALFVHLKRHPLYNAQSLLEARVKFSGHRRAWYSFQPAEYDKLKKFAPCEQVAGQVYFTNRAIEKGLEQIDTRRWLQVNYEGFCVNPEQVFYQIADKFAQQGHQVDDWRYKGLERFESTNQVRITEKDCRKIICAYRRFSGTEIEF